MIVYRLVCQLRGRGSNLHPLANSAVMSTGTLHCEWEDQAVWERSGQPPASAEAKKLKSLTLHIRGCLSGYHKRQMDQEFDDIRWQQRR